MLPLVAECAQSVRIGNPGRLCGQHLPLSRCGIADQQRACRCIVDVGHRRRGVGGNAFGDTEVIDVADHHAHLIADLSLAKRVGAAGGASDVDEGNPVGLLPLEGELRIGQAIDVDEGRQVGGQHLVLRRKPEDARPCGRCVVRRRVDELQRAIAILIHRPNTDVQARDIIRHPVGGARRPRCLAGGDKGDVFIDARTGNVFDLPVVRHRTGNRTGRVGRTDTVRVAQ
ncbi:hypothetical protein D3C76_691550 [compost metagenome]